MELPLRLLELGLLLLDPEHELLPHLLLALVQARQVTLPPHRVRLREAARLAVLALLLRNNNK